VLNAERRTSEVGLATLAGLMLVVWFACDRLDPRAPRDLAVSAATDSTVRLQWAEPSDGTPEAYLIYFRPTGDELYGLVAETLATEFEHLPQGRTGRYRVAARFGPATYESDVEPVTTPAATGLATLAELNEIGNSGLGWNRVTGKGRTYSMRNADNRDRTDFYITDFRPASLPELPYAVASPSMGPADAGAVVPADTWRSNRFTDPLPDTESVLPSASVPVYYHYTDISQLPCNIGCFTADSHYALVRVLEVDSADGWVRLQTWFQQVKGLRLLAH
jgi:hypothetical protein